MFPSHPTVQLDPIPGYPSYSICRFGVIFRDGWPLKSTKQNSTTGYLRVGLYKDKKCRLLYVHRLVLETYVGPCPPGMEALHGPGGMYDNRPENLRWGTRSENRNDWDIKGHNIGSRHVRAKLTESDIPIIRSMPTGEAAKRFGISLVHASMIKHRKRWNHVP